MKTFRVILVAFMIFSSLKISSQGLDNLWIIGNIGSGAIKGDIGPTNYSLNGFGLISGLQLVKEFSFGVNTGLGYQFDYITNNDKNGPNSLRGYEINSKLNEFEVILNYNVLHLFTKNDFPIKLSPGIIACYFISSHKLLEGNIVYSQLEYFKTKSNGFIFYPSLTISYCIKRIEFGICTQVGFTNSDYLEGYSNRFSVLNDGILKFTLKIGYKIN